MRLKLSRRSQTALRASALSAVVALVLSLPGKLDPATPPRAAPQPPIELLAAVEEYPEDTLAAETPILPIAATRPTTAPFLRGLYTGAARTAVNSSGKSHVVWMEVTAYCPCPICCGPRAAGVTASGKPVGYNGGAFVAADADRLPFGAKVSIPGYHEGAVVEVIDRGSAILGPRLDVFFPTHDQATAWGRQWVAVTVEGN